MRRAFSLLVSFLALTGCPGGETLAQGPQTTRLIEVVRLLGLPRDAAEKLPWPDFMMRAMPDGYPRAQSTWRAGEKARYQALLAKGRFDALVLPFQVQERAFARDLRSLMTAQLAMAIGDTAKWSIPDPYLVARALGDGQRRLDFAEIFRLANALKVKRIVAGYVGHDAGHSMRVTLDVYEREGEEPFSETRFGVKAGYVGRAFLSDQVKYRHWENIAYSDASPPSDAFQAALPSILAFLGIDPSTLAAKQPVSRFAGARLPDSPVAAIAASPDPARDAYFLQLFAALAPASADRERERMVEKSLLAVLRMSARSPDYRVLKARALMYLGLRPAALLALGKPATPEEKHLLGVLNGNLPEVRANRPSIPQGARALIALLEENAIAVAYDAQDKRSGEAIASLGLPGELWGYLARRAATDADLWQQYANLELKALLDREMPVSGFTAEGMVRGAAAVGDMEKLRSKADLSVLDHVRKYMEQPAAQSCCNAVAARATERDLLDLLEGIATDNLMRRAKFLADVQGTPDAAARFLRGLETTYRDHPDFAAVRGHVESKLAEAASGAEQESLAKSAYVDGWNAWYWEQGQTRTAAQGYGLIGQRVDYGMFDNWYALDYPYRPFFPVWQNGGDAERAEASARAALANTCFEFAPVPYLAWSLGDLEKRWDKVDALAASIEGRFKGSSDRVKLLATVSVRRGDTQKAARYYAEGLRLQPEAQDLYEEYGRLLFENGEQQQSAEVFLGFPGLKAKSGNPVGLSNYAYGAGSLFYWSGDLGHALPLYQVAADLNTGSAASIASATRIALVNGDYLGALRGSLERGQRYNSSYGYRDYLALLHVMGFSKPAWDGFKLLIRNSDEPHFWEAALVGHQIDGASESEIAAWAGQEPMHGAGHRDAYAAIYMLRAGVTDRKPSADLAARIAQLDRPVWSVNGENTIRLTADGSADYIVGPNAPNPSVLPVGVFAASPKVRVKSDLVYYAEAYDAIGSGRFDAAQAGLREATGYYDVRQEALGYLLPAYAYAAVRSGEVAGLARLLARFEAKHQRFDYHLAQAILSAAAGKHDEAARRLNLALVRRPYTEHRPLFTEYQYAEVCEWLFEMTRDARYRNIALDWAKKNELVNPWFAWPYAIDARFNPNAEERARAIAMAHYLDRNSHRLGMLPRTEIDKAVRENEGRNPFRRAADQVPKQPT